MKKNIILKGIVANEKVLDDDYPVYWDYLYVADGKVIVSEFRGTVRKLKQHTGAKEIRNCNMVGRNLF